MSRDLRLLAWASASCCPYDCFGHENNFHRPHRLIKDAGLQVQGNFYMSRAWQMGLISNTGICSSLKGVKFEQWIRKNHYLLAVNFSYGHFRQVVLLVWHCISIFVPLSIHFVSTKNLEGIVGFFLSYSLQIIHILWWLQWPSLRAQSASKLCEGIMCNDMLMDMLNTLRPRQNGRQLPDDNFKCIFLNENV